MKLSASAVMRGLPDVSSSLVQAIVSVADALDVPVYFVGGPVRDALLDRPLRDIDLLFETHPEATRRVLEQAMPPGARLTAHERFGTFKLRNEGSLIDVSTARRETYSHDGALPLVEPGNLYEDLARRDFSCNAVALPVSSAARARHEDLVAAEGALSDVEHRRLRVLHRGSFRDDATRALRAARLGARLGFSLTRDSRTALRDALRDGAFGRVSADRLRNEWIRLFEDVSQGLDPVRALRLLADWHVLGALEPGLELLPESIVPLRRLGNFVTRPAFEAGRWSAWRVGLALWLSPLAAGLRRRTLSRLGVRGAAAERIAGFRKARDRTLRALESARGRGAVDGALNGLHEEELIGVLVGSPTALRRRIVRYASADRQRKLPLQSTDWEELGLEGPALGRIQEELRVAFLDGQAPTREAALVLAGELARRRRGRPKRS